MADYRIQPDQGADAGWGPWSEWTLSSEHNEYYRWRRNATNGQQIQWQSELRERDLQQTSHQPRTPYTDTIPTATGNSPERHLSNYGYGASSDQQNNPNPAYHYSGSPQSGATNPFYGVASSSQLQQPAQGSYGTTYGTSQQAQSAHPTHIKTKDATELEQDDHEYLDPSYKRVRPKDMGKFFTPGRVLALLWTEPSTLPKPSNATDAFSLIRYQEHVYSEIRRFIVIRDVQPYHSICVPIMTYGKRGTMDRPDAAHHAIAYMQGTEPRPFQGEPLVRHPMEIEPHGNEVLHPASRINFCKLYTIEHNVKVKRIGKVTPNSLAWLLAYYRESNDLSDQQ